MPLRFDPSALLAQGGIMHGLDDMGAAVMNAMNSRQARKYQAEAAARQRSEQLSDRETGRAQSLADQGRNRENQLQDEAFRNAGPEMADEDIAALHPALQPAARSRREAAQRHEYDKVLQGAISAMQGPEGVETPGGVVPMGRASRGASAAGVLGGGDGPTQSDAARRAMLVLALSRVQKTTKTLVPNKIQGLPGETVETPVPLSDQMKQAQDALNALHGMMGDDGGDSSASVDGAHVGGRATKVAPTRGNVATIRLLLAHPGSQKYLSPEQRKIFEDYIGPSTPAAPESLLPSWLNQFPKSPSAPAQQAAAALAPAQPVDQAPAPMNLMDEFNRGQAAVNAGLRNRDPAMDEGLQEIMRLARQQGVTDAHDYDTGPLARGAGSTIQPGFDDAGSRVYPGLAPGIGGFERSGVAEFHPDPRFYEHMLVTDERLKSAVGKILPALQLENSDLAETLQHALNDNVDTGAKVRGVLGGGSSRVRLRAIVDYLVKIRKLDPAYRQF